MSHRLRSALDLRGNQVGSHGLLSVRFGNSPHAGPVVEFVFCSLEHFFDLFVGGAAAFIELVGQLDKQPCRGNHQQGKQDQFS